MSRKFIVSAIALIFGSYLLFLFIRASDNPDFCKSCHFMKPYYDNWASSSHNTVPCYKCHYGPGFKDYIGGKLRLLGEIIRYFAGAFHRELHTKIKDEVCYSCHKKEDFMDETLEFTEKEIKFTHAEHMGNKIREFNFKCQNCHSELVQGKHTAVSIRVCILCHFIGKRGEPKGGCGVCHGPPKEEMLLWGVPFGHLKYIKAGVSCNTCHIKVTQGRGDVKAGKCEECHVEVKKEMFNYKRVHKTHVRENNLSCFKCHEEIKHGKIQILQVFSPLCQECHGNRHSVQEEIYSGTGGLNVPNLPDRMFISGVVCQGCHQIRVKKTDIGPIFELPKAEPSSCVFCHGKNFDKLLVKWQNLIKERLNYLKTKAKIYSLFRKFGILNYNNKTVDINLKIVENDRSFGAHNIRYINLLLDAVEKEIGSEIKKPDIEYIYARNSQCIECHFGIENKNSKLNDIRFLHGPHLFKYRCATCHIEKEPSSNIHGRLKKSFKNCDSCHHKKKEDCKSCHKLQYAFYNGKFLSDSPDVMKEAEVECEDCHLQNEKIERPNSNICAVCHDEDYAKEYDKKSKEIKKNMKKFEEQIENIVSSLKKQGDKGKVSKFYKFFKEFEKFKKEGSYGTHNLMFREDFSERLNYFIDLKN